MCACRTSRFGLQAVAEPVDEPRSEWTIRHIIGICLNIVRFKKTIATFLAILAVAAGVPEGYASQGVVTAHAQRSSQVGIPSWVLQKNAAPAETSASRDGARIRAAAASRPNPLHSGIASVRVVPSSPNRSGTVVRASGAPTPSVPVPTALVRGPPFAI